MSVKKNDIVREFAKEYGTTIENANNIYTSFMEFLVNLIRDRDILVTPIGTFKHVYIPGRPYYFPKYNKRGISPDKIKVVFKPSRNIETIDVIEHTPEEVAAYDFEGNAERRKAWIESHHYSTQYDNFDETVLEEEDDG